jgi:SpoVK/Ycf46/Vps4 family AAA+-type ATPase
LCPKVVECLDRGADPLGEVELSFLFVGPPGTGKTTVARRVGQLFSSLGLLATEDVVECSVSDFMTGYANQAAARTR